jgi:hypothetical protein
MFRLYDWYRRVCMAVVSCAGWAGRASHIPPVLGSSPTRPTDLSARHRRRPRQRAQPARRAPRLCYFYAKCTDLIHDAITRAPTRRKRPVCARQRRTNPATAPRHREPPGVHGRGNRQRYLRTRRTPPEAEDLLAESIQGTEAAGIKYERYWIEEIDTTGLWQPPAQPKPRDRYATHVTTAKKPGSWQTVHVEVLDGETLIASYDRNYSMLQTFEPFRQGERAFALISTHYTATSVMDLHTGHIAVAEEPAANGFCPVGFYVPDWWDLHDGTKLPGSMNWRPADDEWPTADFGFVWGCIWGGGSSWKVQYLDLSQVADGVIRRDDRFGYLKLATDPKLQPRDFIIRCSSWQGERRVEFYIEQGLNPTTGAPIPDEDW